MSMNIIKEERKERIQSQIYCAARAGNFQLVQNLYKKGGDVSLALMGALYSQKKSRGPRAQKCKAIVKWALDCKAHYLFGYIPPINPDKLTPC